MPGQEEADEVVANIGMILLAMLVGAAVALGIGTVKVLQALRVIHP